MTVLVGAFEWEYGVRRASDPPDFARLRVAAERLRWVGRDDPSVRYNLAMHALRDDATSTPRAASSSAASALQRTPHAWLALGVVEQRAGAWRDALRAFDAALELDPASVAAWSRKAQVWVRLGERAQAREALERALTLAPERLDLQQRLAELEKT